MSLEGTLNYLDVAHLLQVVGASRKSGVLEISWEDRSARLIFERGDLTGARSNTCHDGIGTLLVKAGLLSAEGLERALERQRCEGTESRRLGAILCDEFDVDPEDIERLLNQQFEQIALDVFSWAGGHFVFQFRDPGSPGDRFRLDALEFILTVGIRAGLLVEKALSVGRMPSRRPMLFVVEEDPTLLSRFEGHWRRKGYAVVGSASTSEVLDALEAPHDGVGRIVIASWGAPVGPEDLRALHERHPDVFAVCLADGVGPGERSEAPVSGAEVFVRKPPAGDLSGSHGDVCFEVFMVSLERTLALVVGETSAVRDDA